ncbi:5-formyltetrahydrofolate cyclo-ligase [Exiguobacterium alkaliphilum]|uniref:5-formyltetrahydrofolate cyclo-ligase n=1 Tax=Exiguobacterium alkaliphilum TaxID=1428684 RepID=UPI00403B0C20
MDAKQALRRAVHARIAELANRDEADAAIVHNVMRLPEWIEARAVALTLSFGLEVDTRPLIEAAWQAGKTVLVPKVTTEGLTFHRIESYDDLEPGVMGILEPTTQQVDGDVDLCVVPGRVFNRSGYRIGWGGGYYDRFLASYAGQTLSLAYSVQVLDDIPIEAHDIPVGVIVSERELIRC